MGGGIVVEIAIGFLSAYLARKAGGLLARAADDVDGVIDDKLGQLYEFVKKRMRRLGRPGERSLERLEEQPDDKRNRSDALEDLAAALKGDEEGAEQLRALVENLQRLDPTGVYLKGVAKATTIVAGASNVGVDIDGQLRPGDTADGTATAGTVAGDQVGTRYRPGQPD
jgi:hypothetical protein